MQLQTSDIIIIITVVLAIGLVFLFNHNRKNYRKMLEAQDFINANKMLTTIFVIDKKFEKPTEQNMPKSIYEKIPASSRRKKMPIVKAKVGPQIHTLMCDKAIYDAIAVKKNVKVELSGIYIATLVGFDLANKKNKTWREKLMVFLNKNK